MYIYIHTHTHVYIHIYVYILLKNPVLIEIMDRIGKEEIELLNIYVWII